MKKHKPAKQIGPTGSLCIVLHGLFFMTIDTSSEQLLVYAPKVKDHKFVGGIRGDVDFLPNKVHDWTKYGLRGGAPYWKKQSDGSFKPRIPDDVPASIFQFTIGETNIGGFKPDDFSSRLAGKILLPWPESFYSLRCDSFSQTFPCKKSDVTDNIKKYCLRGKKDAPIGSSTCLRYLYDRNSFPPFQQWEPGMVVHVYIQPCKPHKILDVNADLAEASKIFLDHTKFKIELDNINVPDTSINSSLCGAPTEVTPDDTYALCEDAHAPNKNVCPDGSAAWRTNRAERRIFASLLQTDRKRWIQKAGGVLGPNPANCPNFLLTP